MTDETELRDLERRLAFIAAKEQVERTENKGWQWHNTKHITAIVGAPALADAIRYLELRGLLERKPDAPHLVRVLEKPKEPDAPRHVCGLQGFGALDDVCPACERWRKEWEKKQAVEQNRQFNDGERAKRTGADHD